MDNADLELYRSAILLSAKEKILQWAIDNANNLTAEQMKSLFSLLDKGEA